MITTSSFSRQAEALAAQAGAVGVILIDGAELAKLMANFNVGVRAARTVDIKRINLDYFGDAEAE